jgi:type I restriction enzyme S subunit
MAAEWPKIKLGDAIELKRGYDLPSRERQEGPFPIVSSSGVSGRHAQAKAKAPGVVIGRYGTLGEVHYITEDYWPLNTALYVRDFKGNDPRFISYFLRTLDFGAYSDKAAVPGLNRNDLHTAQVVLPPLSEQRAIAQILGALDDKIELNRRMNETLEGMARALFKSWFVDFDPVRAKMEGRDTGLPKPLTDLFPACLIDSAFGEIPAGWECCPLGQLVDLVRGRTYKSSLKDLPGPVLLGLASIERNGGFRDDKLSTYGGDSPPELVLAPGDIYVSLKDVTQSADLLGAVARVPAHVERGRLTQDTVRLKFRSPDISHEIVYRSLLTAEYREYCRSHATGTTNLGLARDDFLAYPIVRPSADIVLAFDTMIGHVHRRAAVAIAQSRTLATLRDALLPKLISGELRVKDAEHAVEVAA